jgi:peroxiredoxin
MALKVGSVAPDFVLPSRRGTETVQVRLADHRGKDVVVLLFFPGAFSGACTREMCEVSEGVHELDGAIVYGISVDSPFAQAAWAEAKGITVPLLSDYGRETIAEYDVQLPNFAGTTGTAAARAVFVVDLDGVIRYSEQTPSAGELPNFAEAARVVRELREGMEALG